MTKPRRRQAGEGGISAYETKAGTRYLTKYSVRQPDGTRKVLLKRGHATRAAAAKYLRDELAKVDRGEHVAPSKVTLGAWLDEWLPGLQLAPSTRASYAKNVRLHITPALGQIHLQHLTAARISTLYRELERSGRRDHQSGAGLSASTVRYVHVILKAALRDAVDQGILASNPADKAKPPAARAAKSPEIHPWSGPQLSTFLTWCRERGAAHATAYHVLAYTGMRRGELLALRWRDLDMDAGRLAVRRSVGVVKVKGQPSQVLEGPTKSSRPRVIDLDPDTVALLKAWRVERGELALQLARHDALIFGTLEGEHLHPERFSARFVEKLDQCRRKVEGEPPPRIRLHDLRHTHASLLLAAGEQVKVVSERLGHASVAITHDIYEHVMPGRQAEAAARFAAIVKGGA